MDAKTFTAQNITPIATIFTNKAKATSIWPCGTGQLKISCSSETTRWEIWSWFGLRNFLRISLTASFSRSLTHSLVKRPHQQPCPEWTFYRAWLCCSGFCPQLRSVLHLVWWVSRTYPTPLSDKVKQRIVLQTISAAANLQFLKLEQWTIDTLKHQQTWSTSISDSTISIHPLRLYPWTTMILFHHI